MSAPIKAISTQFQSTLPRGSDFMRFKTIYDTYISIHAPSRERQFTSHNYYTKNLISIHAPSRERPITAYQLRQNKPFQSTLPRGSDLTPFVILTIGSHFNPRSLAGATYQSFLGALNVRISIHAPSRERPVSIVTVSTIRNFNPRSLAGATMYQGTLRHARLDFNPRSLAGATYALF